MSDYTINYNTNNRTPTNSINSECIEPSPVEKNFRLCSKKLLLTYSQTGDSGIHKENLLLFLQDFGELVNYVIAQEKHQDGEPHFHCALAYANKLDIRNPRAFDFEGIHPKVEGVRNWSHVVKYCTKDGDYISGGLDEDFWLDVKQSTSVEDFMSKWLEKKPKDYWINYDRLFGAAEKHFKRKSVMDFTPVFKNEDFIIPEGMSNWISTNLVKGGQQVGLFRPRSLVLCGPSRTGKTCFTRSIGPHSYFGGDWNLDAYRADGWYFIFDDVPWDRFKYNWKSWLGCQRDFTVTDKYKSKRLIKGGIPTLFLCNEENNPLNFLSLSEKDWFYKNVDFIEIKNNLYK